MTGLKKQQGQFDLRQTERHYRIILFVFVIICCCISGSLYFVY